LLFQHRAQRFGGIHAMANRFVAGALKLQLEQ